MTSKANLILCLGAITMQCVAQIAVRGKVVDAATKAPLAFTNIGILNSEVGTISDLDGTFSLTIPNSYAKARLIISALGYSRRYLPIDSIQGLSYMLVPLHENVQQLQAVLVRGRKSFKKFQLGNDTYEGAAFYADTIHAGSSMAILIDNKSEAGLSFPANLEEARVKINKNTLKEFKIRIRIMTVDPKTGMPGSDILEKSIVKTSKIRSGWLVFRLTDYNIAVDGPFFLAYEWILESADRKFLHAQFESWKKRHPQLISVDYSIVNGNKVAYANYNSNFWAGSYFAMAVSPDILSQFKCYYRYNSFGTWMVSPSVITTKIVVSN